MIYWTRLDQGLEAFYDNISIKAELSILTLVLTYWLGDSLCIDPILTWSKNAFLQKYKLIISHLRLQLPILILVALQFGVLQVIEFSLFDFPDWAKNILIFCLSLLAMIMASPFIMVTCWGATPLRLKSTKHLITTELQTNQVSVTQILAWPEHIISTTTAGVIGFIPGCRYLLISQQLVDNLSSEELRAVIAHEAGHLRKHHLLFFLLGFISFNGVLILTYHILYGFQWLYFLESSIWPYAILTALELLLFFRIVLGFLSRNFERQADCNSLERTGFMPIKQALLKVAWLNGIDPEENNWHHYGIQQRLQFLSDCTISPELAKQHHQRVSIIKATCIVLVMMLIGLNSSVMSEKIQLEIFEFLLPEKLQLLKEQSVENPILLRQMTDLAIRYQVNDRIDQAEPIYRKLLDITPHDTLVLNNLAWLLVTHFDDYPEKIEESLALALLAVKQEEAAFILDTLAESYLKNGNYQQAFQTAHQALRLAQQGKGISPEAGMDYYQKRFDYFQQFISTE
ncbi:MAG: M48 family metalloprotease [SAR324 cluster bacterium]|nr:M48 family metalloprotease [SAR324 cluster bacterium]